MKKLVLFLSVICLMTACGTDETKCEDVLCTDSTSVCCDTTKVDSCSVGTTTIAPFDSTNK